MNNDTDRELAHLLGRGEPDLMMLRSRLAEQATADGLLDVAYRTVDSPVGTLLLATTDIGLVRVAFDSEGLDDVLQSLSDEVSPRVLSAPARLDVVARELDEYFTGTRTAFDLALDRRLSHGFRRTVLEHLTDIAYGHTASYTALADLAGNPRAVRAAASACATNPIPVVVPCHRVIRSDGTFGQYRGGPEAKRTLLTLESNDVHEKTLS